MQLKSCIQFASDLIASNVYTNRIFAYNREFSFASRHDADNGEGDDDDGDGWQNDVG